MWFSLFYNQLDRFEEKNHIHCAFSCPFKSLWSNLATPFSCSLLHRFSSLKVCGYSFMQDITLLNSTAGAVWTLTGLLQQVCYFLILALCCISAAAVWDMRAVAWPSLRKVLASSKDAAHVSSEYIGAHGWLSNCINIKLKKSFSWYSVFTPMRLCGFDQKRLYALWPNIFAFVSRVRLTMHQNRLVRSDALLWLMLKLHIFF